MNIKDFKSLDQYEIESIKNQYTLSYLNIAQLSSVTGITIMLVMSAFDIRAGNLTIGGFVVLTPTCFSFTNHSIFRRFIVKFDNL